MDFKKIQLVLGREFSIRVKKKSFIITTIVVPILFAALCIVPTLIMLWDTDNQVRRIAVLDHSGIVAANLVNSGNIEYSFMENVSKEELTATLDDSDMYAAIEISGLDSSNNLSVTAYSRKQINNSVTEAIQSSVNGIVEKNKLKSYNLDNFDSILADLNTEVRMDTYILGDDGETKKTMLGINMGISFVMGFIIYIFVTMFGQMVLTSVINEKSNKIVEVIVSSVKPFEMMMGKILGVACVALTQFVIWIVFTGILLAGFAALGGAELLSDPQASSQMMAI